MQEKITPEHLKRQAVVYVRQSSLGQVKRNVEGARVQRSLEHRARELGWSEVEVIDEDQGQSGTGSEKRQGFQRLLRAVGAGEVGILLASEVSRLSRHSVDCEVLLNYCLFTGTLVGDSSQVYDPRLTYDRTFLGLQGTLAVHEHSVLRKRMQEGVRMKAQRGELHNATPPGYVYVRGHGLEKHPDVRVRRAIEEVFELFERCTSVRQLWVQLLEAEKRLPVVRHGAEWSEVEWVEPDYFRLTYLLKNPTYAGFYVFGRTQMQGELTEDGHVRKRQRWVGRGEWQVVLEGRLPAYLTAEQYERNVQKIAMNANQFGSRVKGAPQKGAGLLVGLLRCGRCGHKLAVSYRERGEPRYHCRGGWPQRAPGSRGCFSFLAKGVEARVLEAVFYAVSPAGVAAAQGAAELLREEWRGRRQTLEEAGKELRYKEDLARRRFMNVDPANKNVYDTLAQEWEQTQVTLKEHEARLERYDREQPELPTPEQRKTLQELGRQLERVWFHPEASPELKKQIVRTLIQEAQADLDEERQETVLTLHWVGGHHTQVREPKPLHKSRQGRQHLVEVLETLCKIAGDEEIARVLNRSGWRSEQGKTWTEERVAQLRKHYRLAEFCPERKEREGWLSQAEAATRLGISPMSVHRLIQHKVLPAEYHPGLPSVIRSADLALPGVKKAVAYIQAHVCAPLPVSADQLRLLWEVDPGTTTQDTAANPSNGA